MILLVYRLEHSLNQHFTNVSMIIERNSYQNIVNEKSLFCFEHLLVLKQQRAEKLIDGLKTC